MKGIMELTSDFVKFMLITLLVTGLVIIVIQFISYIINLSHEDAKREAYYLSNYLLASNCLISTEKSLFIETKLDEVEADPSCINYPKAKVELNLINCGYHSNCDWSFELDPDVDYMEEKAIFDVAIKMNDGSIEPAKMEVKV